MVGAILFNWADLGVVLERESEASVLRREEKKFRKMAGFLCGAREAPTPGERSASRLT